MKSTFIYALVGIILSMCVVSCSILPKAPTSPWADTGQKSSKDSEDRAKETQKTKDQVEKARDDVGNIRGKVLEHTGKIKSKDPKGSMKPEVDGIEGEMENQAKVKAELDSVVDDLNQHKGALIVDQQKIKHLEDTIVAKDEQIKTDRKAHAKVVEELNKKLDISNSKYMRILIILSTVLMAISGMMFFHKPTKQSLSVGVGGAILLVVALSVQHYSEKFALVGFGAIVIALAIIVWKAIEFSKTMKAKDEVEEDFEEVVETVELVKEKLQEPQKTEVFGSRNSDGMVGTIQSKRAKQRILQTRKKVNDKNKPTMEG
jgi:F0F1-type ATP synthase assembly protein I